MRKAGDEMKKGIIVTSFGTTHEDTRRLCIESVEDQIRDEFKDYLVLRAFTSRIVISRLKKNHDYPVDNPTEALEKMKLKGIKEIYLQPLLIMEGHEYDKTVAEVSDFLKQNKDFNIKIGNPLLSSEKDYEDSIDALDIPNLSAHEGFVLMGHGTYHQADVTYEKIEKLMRDKGYNNVFVGTVEGSKTIEDILDDLKMKKISKVTLKPFMLVAGDHAKNDMASDEEDSWKTILEKNGIEVDVKIKGLGENMKIRQIFISHLKDII